MALSPAAEQSFSAFLQEHELFELLPTHGKVVTLDADLPMKHALDALASHSASCLPVWDSYQQRFVDVFTCTDLVDIVLFTHRALAASAGASAGAGAAGAARGEAQQAIERCQLRDLHGLKRSKPSGFVMASVDDSMYHGCLMLKQHQLECLPLGDAACSSSLLHLLLPEQVLAFVTASPEFRQGAPHLFGASLAQAVLPHCGALRTVSRSASLADALLLLSEGRLHALPVLDDAGALVDVLSCRDVRHLASQSKTGDLTASLEDSLLTLPPKEQRLQTCSPNDSLLSALPRLATSETAQLVCVDERGAVCSVVTSMALLTGLLTPAPGAAVQAAAPEGGE
eukprot:Transcript_3831.p1 GENE.Transcript_3831~~Transcript_3831.p1  ORF type:complete len:372 (-),score=98.48 Transcript_3831:177-1199(-)